MATTASERKCVFDICIAFAWCVVCVVIAVASDDLVVKVFFACLWLPFSITLCMLCCDYGQIEARENGTVVSEVVDE